MAEEIQHFKGELVRVDPEGFSSRVSSSSQEDRETQDSFGKLEGTQSCSRAAFQIPVGHGGIQIQMPMQFQEQSLLKKIF
jgi:hypothetical protein